MLEKFLTQLMTQAGLSPQMIVQAYNKVMGWDAEKDAFKSGAANVIAHFNSRLNAIEERQAEILQLLRMATQNEVAALKINGASHNVGTADPA